MSKYGSRVPCKVIGYRFPHVGSPVPGSRWRHLSGGSQVPGPGSQVKSPRWKVSGPGCRVLYMGLGAGSQVKGLESWIPHKGPGSRVLGSGSDFSGMPILKDICERSGLENYTSNNMTQHDKTQHNTSTTQHNTRQHEYTTTQHEYNTTQRETTQHKFCFDLFTSSLHTRNLVY